MLYCPICLQTYFWHQGRIICDLSLKWLFFSSKVERSTCSLHISWTYTPFLYLSWSRNSHICLTDRRLSRKPLKTKQRWQCDTTIHCWVFYRKLAASPSPTSNHMWSQRIEMRNIKRVSQMLNMWRDYLFFIVSERAAPSCHLPAGPYEICIFFSSISFCFSKFIENKLQSRARLHLFSKHVWVAFHHLPVFFF